MPLADVDKIYAEDPKLNKKDVSALIEWLETQLHLPELTELQVVLFLHSCYYETEAAKRTIDNYFTVRATSDIFLSGDEALIRRTLASFFIGFMPKRTPDGNAVLLGRLLDTRPEKYVPAEHTKLTFMIMMLYFHQFGPANGLILIYDNEGVTWGHMFRVNISIMRQLTHFVQEAAPIRIKGIHHTNVGPLTQHFTSIVKPFIRKEIYNLFKFHPASSNSLDPFVPKECLPKEYGGELPSLRELNEENERNLLAHMDFFKWHDTQMVDEAKREVKKSKGFFGSLQGFFRKPQE